MISDALRIDTESWAARRNERGLFRFAKEGRLTKAMTMRYIANVTFLIGRTPGHLIAARNKARAAGQEALSAFYDQKLGEESGHVKWGESDLESLTTMVAAPVRTATPAVEALDNYLTEVIERDPALYLPYVAFTEYVTVLVGPELLGNIEERCGVPRTSMTVVDNHVELDRDHAEESFGIIDDLVGDPKKLPLLRQSLASILSFFDAFCEEVTEVADAPEQRQVSAA